MKVTIISDVHNNLVNLEKVLGFCKKENIRTMVCCGDLASLEALDFLNEGFDGKIHFVFGNMDNDFLKEYPFKNDSYKKTEIYSRNFGEAEIAGIGIAFTHFPDIAKEIGRTGKYRFVFYGHTHKPWEENVGDCKLLNPGNVAGDLYPSTFAVWETDTSQFTLIRTSLIA